MGMKNKQLYIIGASGHGKVVAEIAMLNGYQEIFFLDDFAKAPTIGEWSIVGTSDISLPADAEVFVAIGDNNIRAKLLKKFQNWKQPTLIHPSATISRSACLGSATVVMAQAVVGLNVRIGDGCIINTSSSVDHDCELGNFVHISPGSHLAGTVKVGAYTWFGIGSVAVQSLSIGEEVIIGAGSVVITSIEEKGTYVGNPCRKIK